MENTFTVTCGACEDEVTFNASDAVLTEDVNYGDFYTIECPVCWTEIHVRTTGEVFFDDIDRS